MKDLNQCGNRRNEEWEILPWIPDPRPPFKIWVKPEQIEPFFLIPHHPYAISLLLKISDKFRIEQFSRLGLTGSSKDWEQLVRGVIREFEENNSGVDLFHFDSDEDVFCVYSQYIDDLMMLAKMIRAACDDERTMKIYLGINEVKELVTQTGIIIKCCKTEIIFLDMQSLVPFSVLKIPSEFSSTAVAFYDLIVEYDQPVALLGCQGNYDIAIQLDEKSGTMTGWHWFK